MSRDDESMVAHCLRATRELHGDEPLAADALDTLTMLLSVELACRNPRFDRDRFYRACDGDNVIPLVRTEV